MSQQGCQQTVFLNNIRCIRPEARREEFKTYLCNSGLMQQMSRALLQLYETKEKPANAVLFFIQAMGGEAPGGWDRATELENMLRASDMQRGELAAELEAVKNSCQQQIQQLQQQQMQQQQQQEQQVQEQQQQSFQSYIEPEAVEPMMSETQVQEVQPLEPMIQSMNESLSESEAGAGNTNQQSMSESGQMTEPSGSGQVTESMGEEQSVSQSQSAQSVQESESGGESGRAIVQESEVESKAVEEFWEQRQSGTYTAETETETVTETGSVAEDPVTVSPSDQVPVEVVGESEAAEAAEEIIEEAEEELGKRQKEMADDGKAKGKTDDEKVEDPVDLSGINLESVHVQYEDEGNEPLEDPSGSITQDDVISSLTDQGSRTGSLSGFGSTDSTSNMSSSSGGGGLDNMSGKSLDYGLNDSDADKVSSTGSLSTVPSTGSFGKDSSSATFEPGSTLDKVNSSGEDKVDNAGGSTGTEEAVDGESQVGDFDMTASDASFDNPLADDDTSSVGSHSTALELIDLAEQTPSEKTEFSSTDKPS